MCGGEDDFLSRGDFAMGEFSRERKFSGGNFLGEILHWESLLYKRNFYTKFLYVSCFLFTDSILPLEILG